MKCYFQIKGIELLDVKIIHQKNPLPSQTILILILVWSIELILRKNL